MFLLDVVSPVTVVADKILPIVAIAALVVLLIIVLKKK